MTLDRGIQILPSISGGSLPHTKTGIVIIGTEAGGTAADNQIYKISNTGEGREIFGEPTSQESVSAYIEIAQRYGAGAILASKATAITDVVNKLPSAYSDFGVTPDVIVLPQPDVGAIEQILEVAENIKAIVLVDFPDSSQVSDIETARSVKAGLGIKNKRFAPCFGYTKSSTKPDWLEPLSVHIAGQIAMFDSKYHAGRIPSNQPLKGVSAIAPKPGATTPNDEEPLVSVSYTSEGADSEKLNDVGVLTVNRREENGEQLIVSWGDRNALYPEDKGYDSLLAVTRINDAALKLVSDRAMLFIDEPSTQLTGETLETSIKAGLGQLSAIGAIDPMYTAEFLESESNYSTGKLVVCFEIRPIVNVRLIQVKPRYRFTISTQRI